MVIETSKSANAALRGLPFTNVEWTDGLYRDVSDVNARVTVPHLQKMFEDKQISHVLENFRIAAGQADGNFDGTVFGDGDFYKWMEAAVCSAVRDRNTALLARLEEYVELIGSAQQPDGYISTKQIIGERNGSACRLSDINDFEVYNFGHLFTAACLYYRLTGKTSLLSIAEKAANYLRGLYEAAARTGEVQTAVCPSHYMGLAELYRTTGNPEYLRLLEQAIRLRDKVKDGLDDNQDRIPLRQHDKIIGHAVRANYLYAGVADLCLEQTDDELLQMLHRVWDNLIHQKLYITGGCGALYNGASPYGDFFHHQLVHQAYGYDYQLPNITAYNETCAAIGGVLWAWRMFCLEKKAEYADVMERMILNTILASVSLDGKKFFYENMLRRAHKLPYSLVWGQERSEYILSYCCPPNLARLLAQLSEYAYAIDDSGLYAILYGANTAQVDLLGKGRFTVHQQTQYPYEGAIRFRFEAEQDSAPFYLYLRIPAWAKSGTLTVLDSTGAERFRQTLTPSEAGSFQKVLIKNVRNTEVSLCLDMPVRLTCANPLVEETNNQVAVERGPLVYCLEGMDVDAATIDDVLIPACGNWRCASAVLDGRTIPVLRGDLLKRVHPRAYDTSALYQEFSSGRLERVSAQLIPYFAWANRGLDEMRIWLPVTDLPMENDPAPL